MNKTKTWLLTTTALVGLAVLPNFALAASGGPALLPGGNLLDLADKSASRANLGVSRGLWAKDYGVRCDGTTDDAGAILAALVIAHAAGLAAVDLPSATCLINSPIIIGDGTESSLSTINGIALRGVAQPFTRINLYGSLGDKGTILKAGAGLTDGKMVQILGPATGNSIQNIALDANLVAATCLEILSARRADFNGISCANYTNIGLNFDVHPSYTGLGDNSQYGIEAINFTNYQSTTSVLGTVGINLDGQPIINVGGSVVGTITGTTLNVTSGSTFLVGDYLSGGTVTIGTHVVSDDGGGNYTITPSQTVASPTTIVNQRIGYDPTRVTFTNTYLIVPASGATVGIRAAFTDQVTFNMTVMTGSGSSDGTSLAIQLVPTTTAGGGRFPQNVVFIGHTDTGQNLGCSAGTPTAGSWPLVGGGNVIENLTSFDNQIIPGYPCTQFLRGRVVSTGNPPFGGKWYEFGQVAERQFRNALVNSNFERSSATTWTDPASETALIDNWIVVSTTPLSGQTFTRLLYSEDSTGFQKPFEAPYLLKLPLGATVYSLAQRIPHVRGGARLYAGHPTTFSFWASGIGCTPTVGGKTTQNFGTGGSPSADVVSFTTANAQLISGAWSHYRMRINPPVVTGKVFGSNNDDFLEVALNVPASSCFMQIAKPQFEEGPVDTIYEERPQRIDDFLAGKVLPFETWTSGRACSPGEAAMDASYFYACTAVDTPKRATLDSF